MNLMEPPAASDEGPHERACQSCRRPLRALRSPRCPWCGMAVAAEDYAAVTQQSQQVLALPDPPPLPTVSSFAQQAEFGWGVWRRRPWNDFLPRSVQSFRPATPGQARLRAVVVSVFGVLAAAEVVRVVYSLWMLHHIMQMLHI